MPSSTWPPCFFLVSGVMILPDAPLVFFLDNRLVLYFQHLQGRGRKRSANLKDWVLAGVFTGLAALSKYHGVFLGVFLMGFCLVHFRRAFWTPGPYVYTAVSLAVFSPVIIWNANHGFVSFVFQGGPGLFRQNQLFRPAPGPGGQAGYLTPLVFALCVWAMVRTLKPGLWKTRRICGSFFISGPRRCCFSIWCPCFRPILPTGLCPDTWF